MSRLQKKLLESYHKLPGYVGIGFLLLVIYDLLLQSQGMMISNNYPSEILSVSYQSYINIAGFLLVLLTISLAYAITKWNWRSTSVVTAATAGLIFISPAHTFFREFVISMSIYIVASVVVSLSSTNDSNDGEIQDLKKKYVNGEIDEEELDGEIDNALVDNKSSWDVISDQRKSREKEKE